MKALVLALCALTSTLSFADTGTLEESGSKQILTITGSSGYGNRVTQVGLVRELHNIGMNAPGTYDANKYPGASSFEGKFMSGNLTAAGGRRAFEITIEQRHLKSRRQAIVQDYTDEDGDTFIVFGDAAEELYGAALEAGYEVTNPGPNSKSPDKGIHGEFFTCTESPLGGMNYRCELRVGK
jgi:hypothetical protein